jgi:Domain of unknown function (DUF4188)
MVASGATGLSEGRAMARIEPNRVTAEIEGDFVVFLIGMRINKPWKVHKWWPVFTAMPKMLRELEAATPDTGFLGHTGISMKTIVQYWRSFDHLERYARSRDNLHWPAWVDFNRRMKNSRGDIGIWHETYLVRAGDYEAIYSGMPLYGLARASRRALLTIETESARQRLAAD